MWILFFIFFIRYEGENAPSVVTSGHFPFRISILYHIFPFSILMNCDHLNPKMKSHLHMWSFGSQDRK